MNKVRVNGNIIELYGSLEIPAYRKVMLDRFLMIESVIGSSIDDLNHHCDKVARYIHKEDKDRALQQNDNLRQALIFILNGINPKSMAFAALVKSINGKDTPYLTDDNISEVVQQINKTGITWAKLCANVDEVKKKLIRKWKSFFQIDQQVLT